MKRALPSAAMLAAILVGALCAFHIWPKPSPPTEAEIAAADDFGVKSEANLIGVEPFITPADYQSAEMLRMRLANYLDKARTVGWLTNRTIVVFPEHLGTWLVTADSPAAVYGAKTVKGAMAASIVARPFRFIAAFLKSHEKDRAAAAVFRMRGSAMAEAYQAVFSELARAYGVTIVAGSIVLEEPRVENGRIVTGAGALYNTSAVFRPDGQPADELVLKVHPIPSEASFTAGASPDALPVFETPAGRLGVLICADSWHPENYEALRSRGAEIIAVPAFLQPSDVWDKPWRGYVTPWPADAPRSEAGKITEGEAWLAHSIPGRAPAAGLRAGMTVFLNGDLWALGADGRTLAIAGDVLYQGERANWGVISVLWLPAAD